MPRLGSIAIFCLILALAAAACIALAGLGYRWHWWGLGTAFGMLPVGALVGAAAAVLALIVGCIGAWRRRLGVLLASAIAVPLAGGALAVPLNMKMTADRVPPIHDITTDSENPPAFVALKSARDQAANGSAYGGAAVAEKQKAGYPDIAPIVLAVPPDQALARAEAAARAMGWSIAAAVPGEGRLEASATTPWWGFVDDIVVRVQPASGGSRVDIRSASRVGVSDLGVNAARIRRFAHTLAAIASAGATK